MANANITSLHTNQEGQNVRTKRRKAASLGPRIVSRSDASSLTVENLTSVEICMIQNYRKLKESAQLMVEATIRRCAVDEVLARPVAQTGPKLRLIVGGGLQ